MAYTDSQRFIWDERKNAANRRKHDLSFEETVELFIGGEDYVEIFDEGASLDEDRFLAIGPIRRGVVVVVWTDRNEGVTRIVSARFATASERRLYRQFQETLP